MGLSRRVLLLWNIRVFLILVLLFPVSDYLSVDRIWRLLIFLIIFVCILVYFLFRYKSCVLELKKESLTLHTGVLIRRALTVKYRHIVAVNEVHTPLSHHLNLCNLLIYFEGAAFLLPPLDKKLTQQIESNIKAEVTKNEA
ncbi:MAG: PH domain-containing protein [Ruminococcus sp.]|nr:PH domain-containing protein [Ruminococcus sp.]